MPLRTNLSRKQTMLLLLPLLVLPFVSLLFWSLGGGKNKVSTTTAVTDQPILKADLPSAKLKDDTKMDKLGYYKLADLDSSKWREQVKQDPYAKEIQRFPVDDPTLSAAPFSFESAGDLSFHPHESSDPAEKKVYAKLHQLQAALQPSADEALPVRIATSRSSPALNEESVNRLSALVEQVHDRKDGEDPELSQLHGLLDKIITLQQPGKVDAASAITDSTPISVVQRWSSIVSFSRLGDNTPATLSSFYGTTSKDSFPTTLRAVVEEGGTVTDGARIRLRITEAFIVDGVVIPKDQFIFAMVQLSNDCVQLALAPLQYLGKLYHTSFAVYDLHGLPCIPVAGANSNDAARQSASQGMQGMGALSLDPSLVAQAAMIGVNSARNLLTKKVKLVKVRLHRHHPLLLIPKL